MTKKNGSKKGVGDVVREQMGALKGVGFADDAEFTGGNEFQPFGRMKSNGELIRDRLIESCRNADGWYIGLDKDIGGNEWQFKDKITSYDHWTNLTFEVSDYVRQKTKLENDRTGRVLNYGSGRYRVIFYNVNGNRGDQEPLIFSVDAQEYLLEAPKHISGLPGGQDVNEILKTVQATSMKPEDLVKAQVEAVNTGMKLALDREDKKESSNNAMMTGMFTMMGTVLASVLGKPAPAPTTDPMQVMNSVLSMVKNVNDMSPKSPPAKPLTETIAELKALGIKVGDNEDALSVLGKVKNMIGLFREVTGGGTGDVTIEKPGIGELLIDKIQPEAITTLVKMFAAQQSANGNGGGTAPAPPMVRRNLPPRRIAPVSSQPEQPAQEVTSDDNPFADEIPHAPAGDAHVEEAPQEQPVDQKQQISEEDTEMLGKIMKFSKELRDAVINDSTDKFPYITETISKFTNQADYNIKIGHVTTEKIVAQIMTLDGKSYADPVMKQKLVSFIDRYISYVRESAPFYAQCNKCHNYGEYESKEEFEKSDDKICEGIGDVMCGGTLTKVY